MARRCGSQIQAVARGGSETSILQGSPSLDLDDDFDTVAGVAIPRGRFEVVPAKILFDRNCSNQPRECRTAAFDLARRYDSVSHFNGERYGNLWYGISYRWEHFDLICELKVLKLRV